MHLARTKSAGRDSCCEAESGRAMPVAMETAIDRPSLADDNAKDNRDDVRSDVIAIGCLVVIGGYRLRGE